MSGSATTHQDGKVKLSEVENVKELTVIVHNDDIEIVNDRADVMDITPESTLAMVAKFTPRVWEMAKQDADFKRRLALVYPDLDIVADPRDVKDYPIAYRHVIGLIICTNQAINSGKHPFWRMPEAYLHPATQGRLVSLMTSYINDAKEMASATE